MGEAASGPEKNDLESLRILGSVGEPINPEAWIWYDEVVGKGRCPIVDTWWQTETGGILITPLPGAIPTKPGSATGRSSACSRRCVDADGQGHRDRGRGRAGADGQLAGADAHDLRRPRALRGDLLQPIQGLVLHRRRLPPRRGRLLLDHRPRRRRDQRLRPPHGHRRGRSALVAHPKVAEAAVVGYPHDIKGQGIYAYVTLNAGEEYTEELRKELVAWVRKEIGPIASPDVIQWAPGLPKTRSGKIMRRILRKIAENDYGALGDTSTLADPGVVDDLIENRENRIGRHPSPFRSGPFGSEHDACGRAVGTRRGNRGYSVAMRGGAQVSRAASSGRQEPQLVPARSSAPISARWRRGWCDDLDDGVEADVKKHARTIGPLSRIAAPGRPASRLAALGLAEGAPAASRRGRLPRLGRGWERRRRRADTFARSRAVDGARPGLAGDVSTARRCSSRRERHRPTHRAKSLGSSSPASS